MNSKDVESNTKPQRASQKCFAWAICAVSFMVQFLSLGFYKSFGPVYVTLLEEFKAGDALTAWVGSMSFAVCFISASVSFEVCRKIGFRPTMCLGSMLYGMALLASSFATSIPVLYVTYGFMLGIANSLVYSASVIILPHYFTTNWGTAHGLALSGNGFGAFALSPFFELVFSHLGYQYGMRVMSAFSILLFLGGLIYRLPDDEDGQATKEGSQEEKEEEQPQMKMLFENKAYCVFIIGSSLMHFGYYIPYVHLVRLSLDLGVTKSKAALLPGYMAIAQIVGKIVQGKLVTFPRVDKITSYQVALLANCLATTLCPVIASYEGLAAYAVVFGLADGATSANNMLVIGELVGRRLLSKGYGFFLLTSAASFLMGPPLAGLLYDLTGSYSIAFFISGGTAFLAACVLFLVPFLRRKQMIVEKEDSLLCHKDKISPIRINSSPTNEKKLEAEENKGKVYKAVKSICKGVMKQSEQPSNENVKNSCSVDDKTPLKTEVDDNEAIDDNEAKTSKQSLTVTWRNSEGPSCEVDQGFKRLSQRLEIHELPGFPDVVWPDAAIDNLLERETVI